MPKRSANELDHLNPMSQLGLCILLDIVGMMTYLLPVLGEFGDLIYAPVQGSAAWLMFGGERWGAAWTVVAVTEEMLPFTDLFPSMTVGWTLKFVL